MHYLGYDGAWCVFLGSYITALTLIWTIFPEIDDAEGSRSDQNLIAEEEQSRVVSDVGLTDTKSFSTQEVSIQEVFVGTDETAAAL